MEKEEIPYYPRVKTALEDSRLALITKVHLEKESKWYDVLVQESLILDEPLLDGTSSETALFQGLYVMEYFFNLCEAVKNDCHFKEADLSKYQFPLTNLL